MKSYIRTILIRLAPEWILSITRKLHYSRALNSFWESDVEIVKKLVQNGQYALDIGAHAGWYTRLLSELVGEQGRVYSIEPVPSTYKLLSYCVNKLRLKNVVLLNCAVSDKNGRATMEIPKYRSGGENFYRAQIVNESRLDGDLRQVEVDLRTVDSIVSGISHRIDFVKCDVEGHELATIGGSRRLIRKSRPAWLLEVSGDPDDGQSSGYQLFNLLGKEGYTAYWSDGQQLRQRVCGDKSVNYFFLTKSHARHLRSAGVEIRDIEA